MPDIQVIALFKGACGQAADTIEWKDADLKSVSCFSVDCCGIVAADIVAPEDVKGFQAIVQFELIIVTVFMVGGHRMPVLLWEGGGGVNKGSD